MTRRERNLIVTVAAIRRWSRSRSSSFPIRLAFVNPELRVALDFLRLKARVRSEFYLQAVHAVDEFYGRATGSVIAEALLAWVDFVNRGIARFRWELRRVLLQRPI